MKTANTVRELIRISRENFSERCAVSCKNSNGEYCIYTYEALFADVKKVARSLSSMGLLGKNIIICGESGYNFTIAYLAVTGYVGTAVGGDAFQ
jgi:acyl-CoA synthetase (AMP-forming)/AMP-acid ligase II